MTVTYPVRPITDSELGEFYAVGEQAFNSNWPTEESLAHALIVFEPERSLAALDGSQIVGTACAYTFGLTVPGGIVDAAGVSAVSVLPSHRRRGILSALMKRQLADISERGEPVAALFASESGIYGRYGYGSAAEHYQFLIRRGEGRLQDPASGPAGPGSGQAANPAGPADDYGSAVTLRLTEPAAGVGEMTAVYDAIRVSRPGMLTRNELWWRLCVADPAYGRDGSSPLRCLIAADGSGPRGYALYAAVPTWGADSIPAHVLTVSELFAVDPAVSVALWRDLFTRDLVAEVKTGERPVDDPLLQLLSDRRRARAHAVDGLWVRLIDLPAALTRRRYACAVDMVLEVTDDLVPANSGRWRLSAGGPADQAPVTCERSSAAAEIALPVAALGAAYLGGTRIGSLAQAGLVAERRPGAIAALSAAMWWDPAPWSPMTF